MLTQRRIDIFKAIVYEFIVHAKPVGSKYLIEKYKWNYSSATVRNEMSALEEMGLLEKNHTSSGRVPSIKGYRFYTQYLMEDKNDQAIENVLTVLFNNRHQTIEETLKQSVDLLSQMTKLTTGVLGDDGRKQFLSDIKIMQLHDEQALVILETDHGHRQSRIFDLDLTSVEQLSQYVEILKARLIGTKMDEVIEKMESIRPILQQTFLDYEVLFEAFANTFLKFVNQQMYVSGKQHLLNQPEFGDLDKMKYVLNILEGSKLWRDLANVGDDYRLQTSPHSQTAWLDDVAVVTSEISLPDAKHTLMVLGPSRMEYDKVVSLVEYISDMIEKIYGDDEINNE